jgi:hypothetical protein
MRFLKEGAGMVHSESDEAEDRKAGNGMRESRWIKADLTAPHIGKEAGSEQIRLNPTKSNQAERNEEWPSRSRVAAAGAQRAKERGGFGYLAPLSSLSSRDCGTAECPWWIIANPSESERIKPFCVVSFVISKADEVERCRPPPRSPFGLPAQAVSFHSAVSKGIRMCGLGARSRKGGFMFGTGIQGLDQT